ncbi:MULTISPECIES: hypothetical protein [unclassified Mycobacterium]|uniref:hypothetical protein n=1 Tax=unclassified Mycobacterium TaxID=2642494 RepID=UPI00074036BA|nr:MULTISPECIES: hypothetical protein [unclassified Mycobacterium]KUH83003.1 hypothetical protein AU187_03315 [Mycobacterium sp. IS-1556]KUH83219.1 hypothetical protein AU185_05450 [Mycobacterium sp. GA-0227b]KUH84371.1 hypothetical protein AU186_21110 [Mycobacterium sp. GA-1999]
MNIVPARLQEQINRIDRTYSLVIGISAGLTALWSFYRVFWLFYTAATFSSVGWSPVSLIVPLLLWVVFGTAAGVVAAAFLLRYAKQP